MHSNRKGEKMSSFLAPAIWFFIFIVGAAYLGMSGDGQAWSSVKSILDMLCVVVPPFLVILLILRTIGFIFGTIQDVIDNIFNKPMRQSAQNPEKLSPEEEKWMRNRRKPHEYDVDGNQIDD
jgi:hypothetical protein